MHTPTSFFFIHALLCANGRDCLPSSRGPVFFLKMATIGTALGIAGVILLHFVVGPAMVSLVLGS